MCQMMLELSKMYGLLAEGLGSVKSLNYCLRLMNVEHYTTIFPNTIFTHHILVVPVSQNVNVSLQCACGEYIKLASWCCWLDWF